MARRVQISPDAQERRTDHRIPLCDACRQPLPVSLDNLQTVTIRANGVWVAQRGRTADIDCMPAVVGVEIQNGVAY